MKKIYLLGLVFSSVLVFSGCVSTVKTYDAYGKLTGSCTASQGLFWGGAAHCYGYANQLNDADTIEMQDIPEQYRVVLKK